MLLQGTTDCMMWLQGQDKVEFLKSQGADVVLDLANTSKETPLNALIKQHAPRGTG
jgi:hypothetical protein